MENLKDTEKFVTYKKALAAEFENINDETVRRFLEDREENLSTYISKLVSWIERMIFNRISKRVNFLLLRMEDGTEQGQMLFWDDTLKRWVAAETSELFWDDTKKRFGIKNASPTSELDVTGTVTMSRLLAGGVNES